MPDQVEQALIRAVRAELRELAVPADAGPMQAYTKSEMPYLGIKTPARRKACSEVFGQFPLAGFDAWRDTVLALWRGAEHREERYAAIDLAGTPSYREYRDRRALPMYREMVVTGAWWDLVDAVAVKQLPDLFASDRAFTTRNMGAWTGSKDLWKRRSAILCQIKRKAATDLDLLTLAIEAAMAEKEFFLKKAIGWALREHAKTDPEWVKAFVADRRGTLSRLSKREALRNVLTKEELARWL